MATFTNAPRRRRPELPLLRRATGQANPEVLREAALALVEGLNAGDWVELRDGEASRYAKLAWHSPLTQRYLFVDRQGLRAMDAAVEELVAAICAGHLNVLGPLPVLTSIAAN